MLKAVVIDDDPLSRLILKKNLLKEVGSVIFKGEADSVESGLELIGDVCPDVIFLDIKMTDGTGFDLIDRVEKITFKIIFTTAYSDYAVEAFKYSAFDYLVKPISGNDIKATLERLSSSSAIDQYKYAETLKENVNAIKSGIATIALPDADGFSIVRVEDITCCEGDRNYTQVFLKNGKSVLVSRTLMEFESLLEPHGFMRIHRSYIVNFKEVEKLMKTKGGMVKMSSGKTYRVSLKYKKEVVEKLLANKL